MSTVTYFPTVAGSVSAPAITSASAITFAGDSITSGFIDSGPGTASNFRWSAQLEKRLTRSFTQHGKVAPTYTNTAVAGQTSAQLLAATTQYLVANQTDIFIMIGVNDVAASVPPATTAANVKSIIDAIQSAQPTTRVHVVSTCFCLGELPSQTNNVNLAATNAAIAAVCNGYSPLLVEWIDVQSEAFAFEDSYNINGYTSGLLTQPNGTHMSLMGTFLISDVVYNALTLNLPPASTPNAIRRYGPSNLTPWGMRRWNIAQQCSPTNLTDWYEPRLGTDGPVAVATGLTADGAMDGAGVGGAGGGAVNVFASGRRWINTNPKNIDWAVGMHIFYAAIAGGQSVSFGLKDTTTSAPAVGVPGVYFTLEPTTNANHILRLTSGGANHDTIGNVIVGSGGISMDIDIVHANSNVYLFFNGAQSTFVADTNLPTVALAPFVSTTTPQAVWQKAFFAYPKV